MENLIGASQPSNQRCINVKHTACGPRGETDIASRANPHTTLSRRLRIIIQILCNRHTRARKREKKKKPSNYLSGSVFLRLIKAGWLHTHIRGFCRLKKKAPLQGDYLHSMCTQRERERGGLLTWQKEAINIYSKESFGLYAVCVLLHIQAPCIVFPVLSRIKSLRRFWSGCIYIYLGALGIIVVCDLHAASPLLLLQISRKQT